MRTPFQQVGAVFIAWTFLASARAQLQPQIQFEGDWLPVVRTTREYTEVLKEGDRRVVRNNDLKLVAAPDFAPGFVEVRDVNVDLDPLRDAKPEDRAQPDAVRFRYTAELVADRSQSDCFALLTFVNEGSVGTKLIPVGHLGAGSAKTIKLELTSNIGKVGSLHVFTEGHEIRSTQHPAPYDLAKYYAGLTAGAGVSAAVLVKSAKDYPHVLSDNGRELATVREKDGKLVLLIIDLVSMKTLAEVPVATADAYFNSLTWVSPHEVVYVAQDDIVNYPWRNRLLLFDVETKEITPLLDRVVFIVGHSRTHPEEIALRDYDQYGTNAHLTYNVRARRVEKFDAPNGRSGYVKFDGDGHARVFEEVDEAADHYLVRTTPDARWRSLDSTVTQPGLRFDSVGIQMLDRVAEVVDIGPDGDTAYISSRLNSDQFELDTYSLSQGKILKTVARLPHNDLAGSDYQLLRLLFAHHDNRLLGIIFDDTFPRVAWLDPRFASIQRHIDAALPGHLNLPVDWSDDGSTMIYLSSNDHDAGTYFAFQPMRGSLIPLLRRNARLANAELATVTAIRFPARDGQRIPAYVTRPVVKAIGPAPLVVLVHGGPMARDLGILDPWAQFLASRGYIVLQVNFRGSSGFGAAFQKAGLESRLDGVTLDDVADGAKFMIRTGEADPKRVAVMGASFGGWATYMSLIKYPSIFCAGVAIEAVSDWRQTEHDDSLSFNNPIGTAYFRTMLQRQVELGGEHAIEPIDRASELHQPILIMHGALDRTVDAHQSERMTQALKVSNSHVFSKEFLHASHQNWPFADEVEMLNSAGAFLEKYVPTATAAGDAAGSKP
ncbi:MAG TPA: prolyl oligopeptidase family serine peptidase [Opitutaceae bacterium]|jgi:dipeptidyl aminopeptidase/acylaminoacyl peptidase